MWCESGWGLKAGDLVELSAKGKKTKGEYNRRKVDRFGVVVSVLEEIESHPDHPVPDSHKLIKVAWNGTPGEPETQTRNELKVVSDIP
jgi:hypothetical protein